MNTSMQTPSPTPYTEKRAPSIRRRAAEILSRPGVRIQIIFATLTFLAVSINSIYLPELAWYALDWNAVYALSPVLYSVLNFLVYLIDGMIILLFVLPLLHGWIRYMFLSCSGMTPPFSVMFSSFGSLERYGRSLRLMLLFALRIAAPLLVFAGMVSFSYLSLTSVARISQASGYILAVFCALAAAIALILGSLWNAGLSLLFFLDINYPKLTVGELHKKANLALKGHRGELWLLHLTALPSLLAGILSLGIYLIFHAIPVQFITLQRALQSITGERLPTTCIVPAVAQDL